MCLHSANAQSKVTFDGIEISAVETNSITYYYGEPVIMHFEFSNVTNNTKQYYKPSTGVNLTFLLRNKSNGKVVEPHLIFWSMGGHERSRMQNEPPSPDEAYQPHEYGHYAVQLNEQFGTEALTDQAVAYNNNLSYRLAALPIGEYELVMKYLLLPVKREMIATFSFKVVALPQEEQEAFKQYVQASAYASNAHFWANNNYVASHKDSYENFLKRYPNSLFAQYAFVDMVKEIYTFAGPSQTSKANKYKEYIEFHSKIKKSNLKMDYLRGLPYYVSLLPSTNAKDHLDKVLYKLKDEHPAYSKGLIRNAELRNKIKGLKNYASKKPSNK